MQNETQQGTAAAQGQNSVRSCLIKRILWEASSWKCLHRSVPMSLLQLWTFALFCSSQAGWDVPVLLPSGAHSTVNVLSHCQAALRGSECARLKFAPRKGWGWSDYWRSKIMQEFVGRAGRRDGAGRWKGGNKSVTVWGVCRLLQRVTAGQDRVGTFSLRNAELGSSLCQSYTGPGTS